MRSLSSLLRLLLVAFILIAFPVVMYGCNQVSAQTPDVGDNGGFLIIDDIAPGNHEDPTDTITETEEEPNELESNEPPYSKEETNPECPETNESPTEENPPVNQEDNESPALHADYVAFMAKYSSCIEDFLANGKTNAAYYFNDKVDEFLSELDNLSAESKALIDNKYSAYLGYWVNISS